VGAKCGDRPIDQGPVATDATRKEGRVLVLWRHGIDASLPSIFALYSLRIKSLIGAHSDLDFIVRISTHRGGRDRKKRDSFVSSASASGEIETFFSIE
jgi:hypothetical protein